MRAADSKPENYPNHLNISVLGLAWTSQSQITSSLGFQGEDLNLPSQGSFMRASRIPTVTNLITLQNIWMLMPSHLVLLVAN